jgi:tetratricopeptide (TPR) repeat protein
MKCPGCDLYHPQRFEYCVSCGKKLVPAASEGGVFETNLASKLPDAQLPTSQPKNSAHPPIAVPLSEEDDNEPRFVSLTRVNPPNPLREQMRTQAKPSRERGKASPSRFSLPTGAAVVLAAVVLLSSAGATIFFLTKPPDDQRLLEQAQRELANGQYAFAVKTLDQARALRPNDAKLYLTLARAYVGIDQVDKAWDAISQAQQLGLAVTTEPELASQLANYYRQRGQFGKALDLLRPLAKAGVPGKRAELADLDALWGDEALRTGQPDIALRCWEEVRDLQEGSRYSEAEARLSTIYNKLANLAEAKGEDDKALSYLAKLNLIAQNAKNYEFAASIYENGGKLDQAIDQIRSGLKASPHEKALEQKLVALLNRRGKELMDQGQADAGFAYLQQAKQLDPDGAVPVAALKDLSISVEDATRFPHVSGQIWNPGLASINSLRIKSELFDTAKSEVVWTKETNVIDEFVAPLAAKESRSFDFLADVPTKTNGQSEFRIYLDGVLYKSYPIGKRSGHPFKDNSETASRTTGNITAKKEEQPVENKAADSLPSEKRENPDAQLPPTAPALDTQPAAPPQSAGNPAVNRSPSAEEKTMKDLEF